MRGFRGNKFDRVCGRDGGGVRIQGFHFQKLRRRVGTKGGNIETGSFSLCECMCMYLCLC